ncbi:hypothetical protein [Dyadobacter pollutisoli]|jgi:hypothetical protein|uniref:Uncharacterized protein n=1 Tax=Dyadobacter pollutisoli TaxID=2910158 RepID=A0A9E8NI22_9BACT|nr:hypothetical protein [Dyadobacter pollutisoli]WAC15366.1 hypothetical protein ON006_15635 [Dyadobacter pollutisoli]
MSIHPITPIKCITKSSSSSYLLWLCFAVLFSLQVNVQAQSYQLAGAKIENDSSNAHWRILTNAATRRTQVQFFGRDQQLLYEEALPEKWIKQNRKTQKQLDKLLSQILANQLLIARLKTEDLPPKLPDPVPTYLNASQDSSSNSGSYSVHATINADAKLYIVVDNPDRFRYKIEVVDHMERSVYKEFTSHDHYRRRLDVSPLPGDSLRVIVGINNQRFIYNIKKQNTKSTYSIQQMVAASQNN